MFRILDLEKLGASLESDSAGDDACRIFVKDAFFDEQEGYLRAALKADGTLPDRIVYQNTHTLGMDYLYGVRLFRRILPKLADYQAVRLWHPMGHTAVAYDSEVPCEMWKSVHMNQHLGHECKTARLGGRADEALHLMRGWLEYFSRYQCAVETFNLAGCDGDSNQLANSSRRPLLGPRRRTGFPVQTAGKCFPGFRTGRLCRRYFR